MHVQPTLRLLVCLLLLLSAGQVFADAAGDIEKLEQERFTAYVKGDAAALERIFADNLVYIHSNGVSDPKSAVLQSFASGELKISRFDAEDIQGRRIGDVMVATGLVHVTCRSGGRRPSPMSRHCEGGRQTQRARLASRPLRFASALRSR
jgi:hypothetical protein